MGNNALEFTVKNARHDDEQCAVVDEAVEDIQCTAHSGDIVSGVLDIASAFEGGFGQVTEETAHSEDHAGDDTPPQFQLSPPVETAGRTDRPKHTAEKSLPGLFGADGGGDLMVASGEIFPGQHPENITAGVHGFGNRNEKQHSGSVCL